MRRLMERWLPHRRRPQGSGACDLEYHEGRRTRASLRYRLRRRTEEVLRCVSRHGPTPPEAILDVGTADGLMLCTLRATFPAALCVGADMAPDLLATCPDPGVARVLADAAALPILPQRFDLVVATAVIEHVPDALRLLLEVRAALRPGGLLVVTTPDPFWESLATLVGHLPDEQHHQTLDIPRLATLCESADLRILESRRFMLSPVGLPWELRVEEAVRRLGLGRLFANQLVAARRP